MVFFIKDDLLSENQKYISELVRQIRSDNLRLFNVISQKQYEEDILKVDFGVFVKIYEEVDGMVHISDLAWNEEESASKLKSTLIKSSI